MIESLLKYNYLQNAMAACLLASVVCGIIGVIIVEKKLIMMSGGIAHTAYGGVGLGYLFGFEPILGAFSFAVLAALGIGSIKRKGKTHTDIAIALFWSLGMALGVLFMELMPSYPPDTDSYLFGNILSVTRFDLKMMMFLTVLIVLLVVMFYNDLKSYMFDDEFASVNGLNTAVLEYGLLLTVALTVVVLIRVAGIILIIALLTAPAATAALLSKNLRNRMIIASVLCFLYCLTGLTTAFYFDLPAGATIIIVAVAVYFITFAALSLINRKK